ncbi:bacterial proteasome activator family protein [Aeromicrobium sp. 179-A 4D2 NHS]|uniref:bacterial proteasome activator family protein n=1 Tax=Aeromicrobium sp. 179-A 4D2 NHS TaxID=3142375 RepID=UPI00399F3331
MTDDRIIDPQGQPVPAPQESTPTPLTDLVEQPAKVMRIGGMIRQLLDEVKSAPLDEASRSRLREIHVQSIDELKDGLAPELIDELERLSLPFDAEAPSEAELRVAQAQLVGWLEGLFHGIQAALYAQQVQAQSQLQNMRLALPGGGSDQGNASDQVTPSETGGMYL